MQFGKRLKAAKDRWDQKELSIRNLKEAQFYSWFVRYKADAIKEKLLYPVRRDVGLRVKGVDRPNTTHKLVIV